MAIHRLTGESIVKWLAAFGRREKDLPDFAGKVVVVYCSSGYGGGAFEDVRVVRVGFSHFVVGHKVELESWGGGPASNVTAWFGINEVSQMHVYDDVEEASRAYRPDGH